MVMDNLEIQVVANGFIVMPVANPSERHVIYDLKKISVFTCHIQLSRFIEKYYSTKTYVDNSHEESRREQ